MTLLHTVTGNCSFAGLNGGSCEVRAFYRRHGGDDDAPLWDVARKRGSGLVALGPGEFINASSYNANNGKWVIARYNAPDRSFIKLLVKKKVNLWGYKSRGLVLMMRDNASVMRVRIPLLDRPDAQMDEGSYEGKFDIIYPSQYEQLGFKMQPQFMEPFELQELADTDPECADDDDEKWFDLQVLQQGDPLVIQRKQEIETHSGRTVEVAAAARPRLITLRKPRK